MASFFSKLFGGGKKSADQSPVFVGQTHEAIVDGLHVQFLMPEGFTTRTGQIGSTEWDGMKTVIYIVFPSGYDVQVYPVGVQLERVFQKEIIDWRSENYPDDPLRVVERRPDCFIYETSESGISFSAILAQKQIGAHAFHMKSEEVHYDMDNKPLFINTADCRTLYAILQSFTIVN